MKFKVGDKVRYKGLLHGNYHRDCLGKLATVFEIFTTGKCNIVIQMENGATFPVFEEEIDMVKPFVEEEKQVEKLNHIENILQEIETLRKNCFDMNTKLGLLSEELIKLSGPSVLWIEAGTKFDFKEEG